MTAKVEVKLKGMSDAGVHRSPCRYVPTLTNLSMKTILVNHPPKQEINQLNLNLVR